MFNLLTALAVTSVAATLPVGPTQPHTTIQDALAVAVAGDVIEVDPGIYTGPITIDVDVDVVGLGGSAVTSITGATFEPTVLIDATASLTGFDVYSNTESAVLVQAGATASIVDLRVSGVAEDHLFVGVGSIVDVSNSVFEDGLNDGIVAFDPVALTVTDSVFERIDGYAVAVLCSGGSCGVQGSTFIDNGGGTSGIDVDGSYFEGNGGAGYPGAIWGGNTVSGSTFIGNFGSEGGAIYSVSTVTESYFEANVATTGGHLYEVINCTDNTFVAGVSATDGGAGYQSCLTNSGNVFEGNTAGGNGGALRYINGSVLRLYGNAFIDNVATGDGGAVFTNTATGDGQIHQNYFCGNQAGGEGGGIYTDFYDDGYGGPFFAPGFDFTNNLFASNTPTGFYHHSEHIIHIWGGSVDARHNLFIGNGDGLNQPRAGNYPDVVNNLFVDNSGVAYDDPINYPFGSRYYNLWWNNGIDSGAADLPSATGIFADPMFVSWTDDGDCRNDDFRLAPGSPASGAGDAGADLGPFGGPNPLSDVDGDGRLDIPNLDNCPNDFNPSQADIDGNRIGDACDDGDGDGVSDALDLCPGFDDNDDSDSDSIPDGCDICAGFDDALDADADGVPDGCDTCAGFDDALDADADGVPDGCDTCAGFDDALDADLDGVPDGCDACANADDLLDADADGVADSCDDCPGSDDGADDDDDGTADGCDLCPGSDDASDADNDGVPDGCDSCADGPDGEDLDDDGVPDACDVCEGSDDNLDADADGVPDGCDVCNDGDDNVDGDGDGVADACDNCVADANPGQANTDGDVLGDDCDPCPELVGELDNDGDGLFTCDDCDDDDPAECDDDEDTGGEVNKKKDGSDGCGCDASSSPAGWVWAALPLLLCVRRRRRIHLICAR